MYWCFAVSDRICFMLIAMKLTKCHLEIRKMFQLATGQKGILSVFSSSLLIFVTYFRKSTFSVNQTLWYYYFQIRLASLRAEILKHFVLKTHLSSKSIRDSKQKGFYLCGYYMQIFTILGFETEKKYAYLLIHIKCQ